MTRAIGIRDLANLPRIFAEVDEDFLSNVKKQILCKTSLSNFANAIGVSQSTLSVALRSNRRLLKISDWLKICELLKLPVEIFERSVKKAVIKSREGIFREHLPICLSKELASLVGHALGDGHISPSGFEYSNKSETLRKSVEKAVNSLFGPQHYFVRNNPKAPTIVYHRLIGDVLVLVGATKGNKVTQPTEIPKWIREGPTDVKQAFVRTLFDDEGTVNSDKHELKLKLAKNAQHLDSLQHFMEQLSALLRDLGIEATSIRKDNEMIGKNGHTIQLVISIHGHQNFSRFLSSIGFEEPGKQTKLERLVEGYQKFKLRSGVGYKLIQEKLNVENTIGELMKATDLSYRSVYKNLRKLEQKGAIEKFEYSRTKPAIWRRLS